MTRNTARRVPYVTTLFVLAAGLLTAAPHCPGHGGIDLRGRVVIVQRMEAGTVWDIVRVAADGTTTNLSNSPGEDREPAWAPAVRQIAFTSDRDGDDEIYRMEADGSNQVRLTNRPGADVSPSWSPTGNRIVFASDRDGGDLDLFTMSENGVSIQQVTRNGCEDGEPAWSPVAPVIAFASDCDGSFEIYVVDIGGVTRTRLTTRPGTNDTDPAWSHDGTRLAFESSPVGNASVSEIFTMNADGTNVAKVFGPDASNPGVEPAWFPDSAAIGFVRYTNNAQLDVYAIAPTGGSLTPFTTASNDERSPVFER